MNERNKSSDFPVVCPGHITIVTSSLALKYVEMLEPMSIFPIGWDRFNEMVVLHFHRRIKLTTPIGRLEVVPLEINSGETRSLTRNIREDMLRFINCGFINDGDSKDEDDILNAYNRVKKARHRYHLLVKRLHQIDRFNRRRLSISRTPSTKRLQTVSLFNDSIAVASKDLAFIAWTLNGIGMRRYDDAIKSVLTLIEEDKDKS